MRSTTICTGQTSATEGGAGPFYDQAKRMLGVVRNPTMTGSDRALLTVAEQMGVRHLP